MIWLAMVFTERKLKKDLFGEAYELPRFLKDVSLQFMHRSLNLDTLINALETEESLKQSEL